MSNTISLASTTGSKNSQRHKKHVVSRVTNNSTAVSIRMRKPLYLTTSSLCRQNAYGMAKPTRTYPPINSMYCKYKH